MQIKSVTNLKNSTDQRLNSHATVFLTNCRNCCTLSMRPLFESGAIFVRMWSELCPKLERSLFETVTNSLKLSHAGKKAHKIRIIFPVLL